MPKSIGFPEGMSFDERHRKQVDNGEWCTICNCYIVRLCDYPGVPDTCEQCKRIHTDTQPIENSMVARCPYCGTTFPVYERCADSPELLDEGEHSLDCHECEREFVITTYVSYEFRSPALEPDEEEEPEDGGEDEGVDPGDD